MRLCILAVAFPIGCDVDGSVLFDALKVLDEGGNCVSREIRVVVTRLSAPFLMCLMFLRCVVCSWPGTQCLYFFILVGCEVAIIGLGRCAFVEDGVHRWPHLIVVVRGIIRCLLYGRVWGVLHFCLPCVACRIVPLPRLGGAFPYRARIDIDGCLASVEMQRRT